MAARRFRGLSGPEAMLFTMTRHGGRHLQSQVAAPRLASCHASRTAHLFKRLRCDRPETSAPTQRSPTSPAVRMTPDGRDALGAYLESSSQRSPNFSSPSAKPYDCEGDRTSWSLPCSDRRAGLRHTHLRSGMPCELRSQIARTLWPECPRKLVKDGW